MSAAKLAAFAVLGSALALVTVRRASAGSVEAAPGDFGVIDAGQVVDTAGGFFDRLMDAPADVPGYVAAGNVGAFLAMIRRAEGTDRAADPYRVCYGYRHTALSLHEHPATSGEWGGERLSDAMCNAAGFGSGCRSTAAGAYQIIRPTWERLRDALALPDFGRESQDAAAVELIRRRGALGDVEAGRIDEAIRKCRREWASLPGNEAGQPQRRRDDLVAWFQQAGGYVA